jgi:hypothetical protein
LREVKYSSSSARFSSSVAMSSSGFLPVTAKTSSRPLDDLRARVVVLVDAVAEAHQRSSPSFTP